MCDFCFTLLLKKNIKTWLLQAFNNNQTPRVPLTNFNDRGRIRQRFIFYTPKNHNFRICLPKKSLLFLAYPKNPLVLFSLPKKIPVSFFHDPKKSRRLSYTQKNHFWPKFQTQKNYLDPPPLSLKYVSGAPGNQTKRCPYIILCNSTPRLCLGCVNSLYTLLPMG